MTACPSDYMLEGYLHDAGASPIAPHVAACATCQAQLARMEREGEVFLREVFPATVERLQDSVAPRPRASRWLYWLAPIPALGAAAALLLAVPGSPPAGYLGTKGGALAVTVFAQTASGPRALTDGDPVAAGSALRFRVSAAQPCRLWIVSVDPAGQISRLYPATGEGGAPLAVVGPLPGGAVLDDETGPERIYALCTPAPLAFAEVARAAVQAAGGGAAAVRRGGPLGGAAAGAPQSTVLVEKYR